jgi:hypothetical protein
MATLLSVASATALNALPVDHGLIEKPDGAVL